MPTICGFRRRGYSPESIVKFIDKIGYTTYDALNEIALLESAVRDDLNSRAIRVSAVLDPVKVVITNYPEGQTEQLIAVNNPENEAARNYTACGFAVTCRPGEMLTACHEFATDYGPGNTPAGTRITLERAVSAEDYLNDFLRYAAG